ncbi:GerAB/ArcD/ProY family transporter [Paenibacillus sp. MMO-58]|uniref:GerAB/ArcD/ProY family transporter n=1 Tax=Paenibacillus sp. MMO-58 TaxID=3081290 RepID=UPI0030160A9C
MVTLRQLATMVILFLIGSSSLFLLGGTAERDAWLSVAVGVLAGFVVISLVTLQIQRLEPDRNLIEIFMLYFGKVIGFVFGLVYVVYFCYKCTRNVREFADLSIMFLLSDTPLSVIMLIICIIGGYAVMGGPGVFFRMAEVLLPILILIYAAIYFLLIMTGTIDLARLLPILEKGFKPVWDAAIPEIISFPFGEMVLFLMFWRYIDKSSFGQVIRITLKSYLFAGLFITVMNVVIIGSLGSLAGWSTATMLIDKTSPIAMLCFSGPAFFFGSFWFKSYSESPRKLFFAHNRVVVIGEKALQRGVNELIDAYFRNSSSRETVSVLATPGTARRILEQFMQLQVRGQV